MRDRRPRTDVRQSLPIDVARRREALREDAADALHPKALAFGLSDSRLLEVIKSVAIVQVGPENPILGPEDASDFLSVVVSGCVKTVADFGEESGHPRMTVQFARPGQFVGMPSASGWDQGYFVAIPHINSTVAIISQKAMHQILVEASPAQRLGLFAYHARAMSRLIYDKTLLLALDVRNRVARELVALQRSFPEGGSRDIDLPLSHADLAELVCASREHVSRALAQMVKADELKFTRRRFRLTEKLRRASARTTESPAAGLLLAGRARSAQVPKLAKLVDRVGFAKARALALTTGARLTMFEPGERIQSTGGLETAILVDGAARVMIDTDENPLAVWVAKEGHFIGLGGARRGSDAPVFWAVALSPCIVASLTRELTSRVLAQAEADEVLRFLNFCHVALSRQLFNRCRMLAQGNVGRLWDQLRILAHDFPRRTPEGVAINLDLPRSDLASLIGVSRTALSRALGQLQADSKVIAKPGGPLVVREGPAGTGEGRPRSARDRRP